MLNNDVLEFLLNKVSKDYVTLEESSRTDSLALKALSETIDKLRGELAGKNKVLEELKNPKDYQKEIIELKNELKTLKITNKNLVKTNKELKEKLSLFSTMKEIENEIKKPEGEVWCYFWTTHIISRIAKPKAIVPPSNDIELILSWIIQNPPVLNLIVLPCSEAE